MILESLVALTKYELCIQFVTIVVPSNKWPIPMKAERYFHSFQSISANTHADVAHWFLNITAKQVPTITRARQTMMMMHQVRRNVRRG